MLLSNVLEQSTHELKLEKEEHDVAGEKCSGGKSTSSPPTRHWNDEDNGQARHLPALLEFVAELFTGHVLGQRGERDKLPTTLRTKLFNHLEA
jgi:hypothetical protein